MENPLVNGIEIVDKDLPAPPPATDSLSAVGFDGTSASGPTPVTGTAIPWGQTRGAFMVGNKVFYGQSDGYLYTARLERLQLRVADDGGPVPRPGLGRA